MSWTQYPYRATDDKNDTAPSLDSLLGGLVIPLSASCFEALDKMLTDQSHSSFSAEDLRASLVDPKRGSKSAVPGSYPSQPLSRSPSGYLYGKYSVYSNPENPAVTKVADSASRSEEVRPLTTSCSNSADPPHSTFSEDPQEKSPTPSFPEAAPCSANHLRSVASASAISHTDTTPSIPGDVKHSKANQSGCDPTENLPVSVDQSHDEDTQGGESKGDDDDFEVISANGKQPKAENGIPGRLRWGRRDVLGSVRGNHTPETYTSNSVLGSEDDWVEV